MLKYTCTAEVSITDWAVGIDTYLPHSTHTHTHTHTHAVCSQTHALFILRGSFFESDQRECFFLICLICNFGGRELI